MDSTFFEFADNLIKNDLSFIKTSSVKSAGMTETYDIQVEEKHEFIANGLFLTTALENIIHMATLPYMTPLSEWLRIFPCDTR